jgi:hypothetical protein
MKKLLLVSALLIFACSSDDSSNNDNNINQNFLQKYDGVIWKAVNDDPVETEEYWMTFSPNGWNECRGIPGVYFGDSYNWDEEMNGYYPTVIENSSERFSIEVTETLGGGSTITYVMIAEATNNGNSLEVTTSDFPDYIVYYDRVSSNPCN